MDAEPEVDLHTTWISLKGLKEAASVSSLYRPQRPKSVASRLPTPSPEETLKGKIQDTPLFANTRRAYFANDSYRRNTTVLPAALSDQQQLRSARREVARLKLEATQMREAHRSEMQTFRSSCERREKREVQALAARVIALERKLKERREAAGQLLPEAASSVFSQVDQVASSGSLLTKVQAVYAQLASLQGSALPHTLVPALLQLRSLLAQLLPN